MAEPTDLTHAGRTLVVVLSMHRSGSSLLVNVLQRLGMSLGPFALMGPAESNKYGHFEAHPFYDLNRDLQTRVFGFPHDLPDSAEALGRFCAGGGQWPPEASLPPALLERGVDLIRRLVASAPVSGFKDPRTALLWPYWSQVFARFPDLRVVPLILVRSPHEIAMSMFTRSKGAFPYHDILEVIAVHFQQLNAIRESWKGDCAVVRFDTRFLAGDARSAAEICRLSWSDQVLSEVFDPACKHHETARVAHRAESLFQRIAPSPIPDGDAENLALLLRDAATRESLLQGCLAETRRQRHNDLRAAKELENQLALITRSRTWRWREHLAGRAPLKWLSRARPPAR